MELQIQNIRKHFKSKTVLQDICLTAKSGTCIGILGSNGSGKSTLLSILAGIQRCDSGVCLLDGEDILNNAARRSQNIGYVPQGTPLMEELTAGDNLLLWYTKEAMTKSLQDGVLSLLGIGDFLKTPVSKLSGGMKKRLSIGCAMAKEPPVLLLDEPTAALDLICKAHITAYLRQYKTKGGLILLTTHDVSEIALCDETYILKDGVLSPYCFDGDTARLIESL